ncbi:hypothetical protein KEJ18_06195 [Candidatus Bathyarchaeota archaeon]|nr:hypothetical protein [Candidatus Bathyarchaeota archaeon]
MPFAAACRKCKTYMIGRTKSDVASEIRRHFQSSHNQFPHPDPIYLDLGDFEPNAVYLVDESGNRYTFMSEIFCSKEYCLATISDKDFDTCALGARKQEALEPVLKKYFPP